MRSSSRLAAFLLASTVLTVASPAHAQNDTEPELVEDDQTQRAQESIDGWNGRLAIGGNLNATSNDDVVGETDGFSALFGLNTTGALNYVSGPHELQNTLNISESFARTPSIGQFVKNNDSFTLDSLYQYFFLPWSGAFGQASLETSLFTTNSVTAESRDYIVQRTDGTTDTFDQIDTFELASPLSPTTLSETVGLFVKPVRETPFTLSVRAGVGARETFAADVLAVDDQEGTEPIEVTELRDVFQGGAEAFAGAEGTFPDRKISYEIGLQGFLPVINNSAGDRSPVELFRYAANGVVSFDAFEWMSLSYNARILRDPQLIERTQIQNNVLLNFSYSIIEPREPEEDQEPTDLEKARQRAEEAEQRAERLEEQLEAMDSDEQQEDGQESNSE